ncbi:MAG: magnesium-translocating P-type ATPase [Sporocytophaga sp.]|uniref:magnesium-translocating P-type ATPase n=1 Tax=Sporocytophaga sp. TaxID=2231183 RepID=UPI001B2E603A|nr:magnesium-translocating P-type ATPase [Sporocytophaga sp.]MBO9701750.1 magnesium-translocating P-type ATPase [Sporocytophaga sp.]
MEKNDLRQLSGQQCEKVFELMKSSAHGIAEYEAQARLKIHGLNNFINEYKFSWAKKLFKSFRNPFNILLVGLAGISLLSHDKRAAIVLSVMVLFSSILRFIQEYKSGKEAEKLRALVGTKAIVYRPEADLAKKYEIAIKNLVPGDVIHLSAGDMIPADVRIISSKDLFINQATLSGEAFPVEKTSNVSVNLETDLFDLENIGFMGSNVVSGFGKAIVLNTGKLTYLGSISEHVLEERETTAFERGITKFSYLLIKFMFVMVPLVFVINGISKGDWIQAFLFAIAVAVGLTPEMLPMIVTTNLAKGAVAMAKKKVIVKRLNSIQNFGAINILCTDKTGTLTQDKVVLIKHIDVKGEESDDVLKYAYLNSYFQTGLKNLLDVAILSQADLTNELKVCTDYSLADEIPFDFERRRMSVVINELHDHHELICKGAVEEIFDVCTKVKIKDQIYDLDDSRRSEIYHLSEELNQDGLRVIAIAYKEIPNINKVYSREDENDLILLGYVAFLDPPKESAAPAIISLKNAGVTIKILTGDNELVTRKVCNQVGVLSDKIILGSEIERSPEDEIPVIAEQYNVFAKLNPDQKRKIIKALQSKGNVVGYMGDGINDAPALKVSDIGISVDSAVDIAKEVADIILLEKSLMVLKDGIIEGRRTFGNTIKYIKMSASSNFGNMFSMVGASLLLPFLPMLPIQLLIQNLLYDISQTAIPFDKVDAEYTLIPRKWDISNITKYMFFIGPISSVFDYITFALLWYIF